MLGVGHRHALAARVLAAGDLHRAVAIEFRTVGGDRALLGHEQQPRGEAVILIRHLERAGKRVDHDAGGIAFVIRRDTDHRPDAVPARIVGSRHVAVGVRDAECAVGKPSQPPRILQVLVDPIRAPFEIGNQIALPVETGCVRRGDEADQQRDARESTYPGCLHGSLRREWNREMKPGEWNRRTQAGRLIGTELDSRWNCGMRKADSPRRGPFTMNRSAAGRRRSRRHRERGRSRT